jgi:hypothetical protein
MVLNFMQEMITGLKLDSRNQLNKERMVGSLNGNSSGILNLRCSAEWNSIQTESV